MPRELEEIGLSPLPEATLALIEWPERAAGALPADRIDIAFSHRPALGSTARAAEITGYGKARGASRAAEGAAAISRPKPAMPMPGGKRMAGDASTRSYARLVRDDGSRHPDELSAAARRRLRSTTENPTARRCIWPKTSSRSSPSPTACASAASRRPRSITPISTHGFLITEDFGSDGCDRRRSAAPDRRTV